MLEYLKASNIEQIILLKQHKQLKLALITVIGISLFIMVENVW